MIAVDTNILVYAHCEESPFHKKTLACITICLKEERHGQSPGHASMNFFQ